MRKYASFLRRILMRAGDVIFLSRPVVLVPVWGFSVLGYHNASSRTVTAASPLELSDFFRMLLFSFAVGAVYILNQIADAKVDAKNSGFALLAQGGVSFTTAYVAMALYLSLSVILPLFVGMPQMAMFSLAAWFVGLVYSIRPAYFTGRPVLDFLSNAVGYGVVAYGVGWFLATDMESVRSVSFVKSSMAYVLCMSAGSISSTLPDIEGDAREGKVTTAVLLGKKGAHMLATLLLAGAWAYGIYLQDWIVIATAGCTLPLYITYFFFSTGRMMELTYKGGGAVLMCAAGVVYPLFLLTGAAVLAATMLYFRIRYGVRYPSLEPASRIHR